MESYELIQMFLQETQGWYSIDRHETDGTIIKFIGRYQTSADNYERGESNVFEFITWAYNQNNK